MNKKVGTISQLQAGLNSTIKAFLESRKKLFIENHSYDPLCFGDGQFHRCPFMRLHRVPDTTRYFPSPFSTHKYHHLISLFTFNPKASSSSNIL